MLYSYSFSSFVFINKYPVVQNRKNQQKLFYQTFESQRGLNRWTQYCSDLYNYETEGDPIVLDCPQIPDEEHHPILREEVEAAIKALKMGKSTGVDNIPAELVQAGEAMIDIPTMMCNKIWKKGEWPTT